MRNAKSFLSVGTFVALVSFISGCSDTVSSEALGESDVASAEENLTGQQAKDLAKAASTIDSASKVLNSTIASASKQCRDLEAAIEAQGKLFAQFKPELAQALESRRSMESLLSMARDAKAIAEAQRASLEGKISAVKDRIAGKTPSERSELIKGELAKAAAATKEARAARTTIATVKAKKPGEMTPQELFWFATNFADLRKTIDEQEKVAAQSKAKAEELQKQDGQDNQKELDLLESLRAGVEKRISEATENVSRLEKALKALSDDITALEGAQKYSDTRIPEVCAKL